MRPKATSVRGLKLLVYAASYRWLVSGGMAWPTSVCGLTGVLGLKLLVYAALLGYEAFSY
jgi:hypothetical protein